MAVDHHLLDGRICQQLLEGPKPHGLAEDQLAEALPRGRLENRRVLVHELPDRLRKWPKRSAAGGGLCAAAIDEAPPKLARQFVQVSAADAFVHPDLRPSRLLLAPGSK
jgi:hypothetical protein